MMKFLLVSLCALVVLTGGAFCTSASIKPVIRHHFEQLSKQHLRHAKEEWLAFGAEFLADTLRHAGLRFCEEEDINWQNVMNITMDRAKEIDIEGETLCALIRDHIEHVFEPLTRTLDQCGQAARSGPLGRSIILALKSFVKHVCNINGEQILEMVNVCSFKGRFTAPECDTFKERANSLQPGNITTTFVQEMCNILPLGRDCFLDTVGQECELEFTKKAWEDLLNSVLTPCQLNEL